MAPISTAAQSASGAGAIIALTVGVVAFVGALSLAVTAQLSPLVLFALPCAVAWLWPRLGAPRAAAASVGVAIAIIAGSLLGASLVFDLSFDGQTYHQSAVRLLAGGWNPVWHAQVVTSHANGLYIETLPKAAWIVEAIIFQATNSLECAKGLGLILLAGAFLLAWPALESVGVRPRRAVIIAALSAASPIAMTELLSFYVDGLVVSSLVMIIALFVLWLQFDRLLFAVPLVAMAAFLVNVKFTGGVYAALAAVVALAIVRTRAPHRLRGAVAIGAMAAALALIDGLNPYVTNTVHHGHPAFPGAGAGAAPVIALVWRDTAFAGRSAPVQLWYSIFAQSTADDREAPRLKLPFTIRAREIAAFSTVDARLAGWGPWFSAALTMAVLLLLMATGRRRAPRARVRHGATMILIISALAVPAGGYARYAPQLWLACIPALLLDDLHGWRTRALAVVIAVNIVIVSATSLGTQLFIERLHRIQLSALAHQAQADTVTVSQFEEPFVNVDLHFRAYGIHWQERATPGCDRPVRLLGTHALVCLPGGRSPAPAPDPIAAAGLMLSALGIERAR